MPKVTYSCIKCGKFFDTEEEAMACEKSHIAIKNINEIYKTDRSAYPEALEAKMEDNSVFRYAIMKKVQHANGESVKEDPELGIPKPRTKWYIGTLSAESRSQWIICLTKPEYMAIRKFFDGGKLIMDNPFSGACYISDVGYETEEEARNAILRGY